MEKGFAQVPLERYDELLLENYKLNTEHLALKQAIESSFRIEDDYRDEPLLKFDCKNFLNIIENLLAKTKYAGKYRVRNADRLYAEIIYGVFERTPEDDEYDGQA